MNSWDWYRTYCMSILTGFTPQGWQNSTHLTVHVPITKSMVCQILMWLQLPTGHHPGTIIRPLTPPPQASASHENSTRDLVIFQTSINHSELYVTG